MSPAQAATCEHGTLTTAYCRECRANPTKPSAARTAHRISELHRAQNLIRGVLAYEYTNLSGESCSQLAEIAGIICVEREHLERSCQTVTT